VISSTARQIHFCVRPTARVIGYAVAVLSSMTQASSLPELPVLKFLTFGIALAKPLTWCSEDAVARSGRLIVFFKEGENVASCLGAPHDLEDWGGKEILKWKCEPYRH
jgi:hypothetical protein